MNIRNKKTIIVLIGILSISLVAGNVLFAASDAFTGREPVTGTISTADIEAVSAGYSADESISGNDYRASDLSGNTSTLAGINAKDVEAVSQPFSATTNGVQVASNINDREPTVGLVPAGDVRFVEGGHTAGSTLVCVVDGVQVSGKVCIN